MGEAGLLYTSHFLSTWNSRVFQFGSVLFISLLYPNTLFPVSVYALTSALPGAVFASRFGNYIDNNNRLKVVRWSIIVPRLAVMLACLLFLFPIANEAVMLTLISLLGGLENSWSIINTVAVERDWVVTVAGTDSDLLGLLNARMRFIDLACKLVGPFVIGLLDSYHHLYAIVTVFGMSCLSSGLEYWAIARVYNAVPQLAVKAFRQTENGSLPTITDNNNYAPSNSTEQDLLLGSDNRFSFWRHPLMPVSLSLTMTYITVLAFSGQMISYLLATGMNVHTLTLFRTGSVFIELSSTFLSALVVRTFGPLKSAAGFIDFQWATLMVTTVLFVKCGIPLSSIVLSIGVAISRIGLWGFDLSTQLLIQNGVKETERGQYSTYEKSLQNWAMILVFISTMILSDPSQFIWPILLSVASVGAALLTMNWYMFNEK